jgi:signal transduction histidine kinase
VKKNLFRRLNLTIAMTLFITAMMFASFMAVGCVLFLLQAAGLLDIGEMIRGSRYFPLFGVLFANFLLATALTAIFSKTALKRLREFIDATRQVARGNFNIKVDEGRGVTELTELAHSINKMAQELASIETLRSDFINNFSHEFKTPIVSIRGFAKLLKEGSATEEEKQEYIDIILTESKRLATLSSNVLNLSKYESLEIVPERVPFRVDEQIRRAVAQTSPKWSAKAIEADVAMEELTYNGNADLTQQIWLNLIDNAIKFTGQGGNIAIRLARWNNGLRFAIKDDGIGMDEQTAAHVFDKFYQGDKSRTQAGNGLGLAIAKRIVELCGGRIDVGSELGKGSEFVVWLPNSS